MRHERGATASRYPTDADKVVETGLIYLLDDRYPKIDPQVLRQQRDDNIPARAIRRLLRNTHGDLMPIAGQPDPLNQIRSSPICCEPKSRRLHSMLRRQPFARQRSGQQLGNNEVGEQFCPSTEIKVKWSVHYVPLK